MGMTKPGHTFLHTWTSVCPCDRFSNVRANDLEQYFGSARYHERRATGRKTASPGVVVRGAVRIVTSVATRLHHFCEADLQPTDVERWYALRDQLDG